MDEKTYNIGILNPPKKWISGIALYVKSSAKALSSWICIDMDHVLLEYQNTDTVLHTLCKLRTSYTEDTTSEIDKWTKETKFSEKDSNYFNYTHINWSNSKKGTRNKFLML